MKTRKKDDALNSYEVLYKAYKWKNGLGEPLTTTEQLLLTSWSEISPTNTVLAGRLTTIQNTDRSQPVDWFLERQRIGYYEHVIRHYFKDVQPEKIARS